MKFIFQLKHLIISAKKCRRLKNDIPLWGQDSNFNFFFQLSGHLFTNNASVRNITFQTICWFNVLV